ncbi:hypothetical protein BP6252_02380 [Coleophoma cylindrospora]|uniref:Uncharacterized protein n=1 Tax=Coleophoma cylindrospora TaxID=1849047 RepID=A0A3D8SEM1_9HELO|nr:hypothetical protein BP6252_02380 [Coleophoma cylindrospora]
MQVAWSVLVSDSWENPEWAASLIQEPPKSCIKAVNVVVKVVSVVARSQGHFDPTVFESQGGGFVGCQVLVNVVSSAAAIVRRSRH